MNQYDLQLVLMTHHNTKAVEQVIEYGDTNGGNDTLNMNVLAVLLQIKYKRSRPTTTIDWELISLFRLVMIKYHTTSLIASLTSSNITVRRTPSSAVPRLAAGLTSSTNSSQLTYQVDIMYQVATLLSSIVLLLLHSGSAHNDEDHLIPSANTVRRIILQHDDDDTIADIHEEDDTIINVIRLVILFQNKYKMIQTFPNSTTTTGNTTATTTDGNTRKNVGTAPIEDIFPTDDIYGRTGTVTVTKNVDNIQYDYAGNDISTKTTSITYYTNHNNIRFNDGDFRNDTTMIERTNDIILSQTNVVMNQYTVMNKDIVIINNDDDDDDDITIDIYDDNTIAVEDRNQYFNYLLNENGTILYDGHYDDDTIAVIYWYTYFKDIVYNIDSIEDSHRRFHFVTSIDEVYYDLLVRSVAGSIP